MNKRIAVALLILSLIGLATFAQDAQKEEFVKFQDRDWGVSFNVTGIINDISVNTFEDVNSNPALQFKKFIKPNLALRVGFGLTSYNIKNETVDSLNTSKISVDSTYKRTDFFIQPGIEYHFSGTKRLDPFIGGALTIGTVGKEKMEVNEVTSDTTGSASVSTNYDMPGGFTFGVNAIIGFNYFIAPKLSLGAEYQWGFLSQRVGGDYSIVTIDDPISGATSTSREVGSNRTTDNGFRMNSTLGVTLTYFFSTSGLKKKKTPASNS